MTDQAKRRQALTVAKDKLQAAKRAIVRVGAGGRGFIVGAGEDRFVITAAHCLPLERLPTPHLANSINEYTFEDIIGPLHAKKLTIWGELCMFNLTDDVAAFAAPDDQELYDQCARYEEFTGAAAMALGKSPDVLAPHLWEDHPGTTAFTLSLKGEWQCCTVYNNGRLLVITEGADAIKGGMSGSPIIDINGAAIGLVSTGSDSHNKNPSLMDCLLPWLLRKLDWQ
ncbi:MULTISPECIES: hypothetical protein [Bradyrhizobium]|uniref:Serine protease n=2 Tax=Bradyrhizobium TaxID=374 RepID=A0ABY0PYS8_9BRAD|nr:MULTISPECIES: hypothetical protein [Bradyrhizobium]SDJ17589.1 hypothetical protein SAMN05444163_4749 [Bradyrhizobium ottawaense]SEC85060.1 hypothetical protein SAMN05444171_2414 [Bradyrhizobium lablabi]